MQTQRYEILAWLGDDHGLTDQQVSDLVRASDEINTRYPDQDDADRRTAALTAEYERMTEPHQHAWRDRGAGTESWCDCGAVL